MPRGGSKDGNGAPFLGNAPINATPDELTALTLHALDQFKATANTNIDLHNAEEVSKAIQGYFERCAARGLRPGNLGLYAALGMTKQEVSDVIRGTNKSKASPATIDLLKKAKAVLSEYREQLGAQGKLNPVTMIFWQKNYDGLTDTQSIEISANTGPAAVLTPEEIAQQIEKDIPIDADFTEKQ